MAQFLRELCTRAQRSTVYTAGQWQEFFLINVGPSGMDVLRAAADTIERAPVERGAEIAALEQRVTDLGVQFAQALSLMAGAASSLEAIDQYPALGVGAWKQARVLREAIEQARTSGLLVTPTACVHDCGQPCTGSKLCQPPADRHPGAKLEDGEEVLG